MKASESYRRQAWQHAKAYAGRFCSEEDAKRYADYYAEIIAAEEDDGYWPPHGPTFNWWRFYNDVECS